MSVTCNMLPYRRLAAPREDRSLLVAPPWVELAGHLASNVELARRAEIDLQGRPLRALAAEARRRLIADAAAYSRQYREVTLPAGHQEAPIVMAGHQPQLFHPGVWCKNFALDRFARSTNSVAVNLVIDSDSVKHTWSRIPGGSLEHPHLVDVPLDTPPSDKIAYEEKRIDSPELFEDFGRRAFETVSPLVPAPLVGEFWPKAIERGRATGNLGLALAQSRHQLEAEWGLSTLELPQSQYCHGEPFWYFLCHLLAQLPRLWEVYNAALVEFRKCNRIRSAAHPVPDLAAEGDWLEAPFWIWSTTSPRRRRLFVRASHDTLVLSDRAEQQWSIDLTPDGDARRAVEQLAALNKAGVRIRTRALITTMYSRLMLSDLFIHGIGGAKYDELTDLLIEQFFQIEPPVYAALTATLRLPVPLPTLEPGQEGWLSHQIRELAYHPEQHLEAALTQAAADGQAENLRALADEKRRWISRQADGDNARTRFLEIHRLNAALRPRISGVADELQGRLDVLRQSDRNRAILGSREYDFCLYPGAMLREFLLQDVPRQL